MQVTFIWSRGDWSVGKALFVPTRYIPFIIIPLTLCSSLAANLDVHICQKLLYLIAILETVAIALSEVTFGLRAYAMWNRNKVVLVVYCCVAIAYVAVEVFVLQSVLPSVTFGEPPIAIIPGCYETGGSSIDFVTFVVIMAAEAVTTTLTVYRAYRHFRHTPNALVQNMTRDGVFYCVTMFSMSIINALFTLLLPIQYTNILDTVYSQIPSDNAYRPRDADATAPPQSRSAHIPHGQIGRRISGADVIHELEDEVTFIWSRRDWSVGKALFVPTRYIPFIIIPLILFSSFAVNVGPHTCKTVLYLLVVFSAVATALSEVIFGLRAYAMWNRDKAILVIYCCVAMAYTAATAFILQSFLPSVTYGEPALPIISGCYKTGASSIVFAAFVIIMVAEAVTTALTLYRALRHFRHTPNALVQNMTRDGVFYCVTMFSMSIANVLIMVLVPVRFSALLLFMLPHSYPQPQSADIITEYQAITHTMLATRMQLHLRKFDQNAYAMDRFAEELAISPMRFTFPADV
ncbi:hypothetical protein PAXINDRAFT_100917 [Paxillus involutus ATCC 200175]|uniref:DUF6533 domain-containing protein n=1 Tax=Paxillus involutus ATCC 200175 TaxID=664439 RepID=A0A0C9TBK7_PAXIN|nr:hypothetical protein PAXINDRAFT_100917 [Paxillus involutus ATCC 200175]